MKKFSIKTTIYLFVILLAHSARGQCPTNTETTHWNSSQSTNTWNWTTPGLTYPIYLQDNLNTATRNIELPYFCTQTGGSGSCGNKNTLAYELMGNTAAVQDIKPEDGWELVLKNFGTANTAPNNNTGRGVANPFFVLYNRHTGRMKSYVAMMGQRSASTALLRVEFMGSGNKNTAVFAHAEAIAQPLQSFNPTNRFNSINDIAQKLYTDDYYWLVSEIQTAYDPCACGTVNNSNPSVIIVTPILITTSSIAADIEGTLDQLVQNGAVTAETSKKTSFAELDKKAVEGFTTWTGYKTRVNNTIDLVGGLYKTFFLKDWHEDQHKNDPTPPPFIVSTAAGDFNIFKTSDDNVKKMTAIDKTANYNQVISGLKGIASFLPYIGSAIAIVDYLSQGGSSNAAAPKPAPPMILQSNLTIKGTITNEQPLTDFAFHNPGTFTGTTSGGHLKPIYNNVLGVFNIIKSPLFEHYKINPTVNQFEFGLHNGQRITENYPELDWAHAQAAPLKQYRIKEDVKYTINPEAKLEAEMIDACFVIEYSNTDNLFLKDPNDYANSKAIPYYQDFYKDNSEITLEARIESMRKSGMFLEFVNGNYPTATDSKIRFRTQYVPLKCLPNLSFIMFGKTAPRIYIKLLIKMKRTDNTSAEGVTQIITYDVTDKFSSSSELSTSINYTANLDVDSWTMGYNAYTGERWFNYFGVEYVHFDIPSLPISNPHYFSNTITYNPTTMGSVVSIKGDIIIPANSTVPAFAYIRTMGKIIVEANVTFGNNVRLIAGKGVSFDPNNQLNPTLKVEIDPVINLSVFNCTTSEVASLVATQSEITSVCNSQPYIQAAAFKSADINPIPAESQNYVTECVIYPNPVSSTLYVSLELDTEAAYTLEITDVNGKTLQQHNKMGRMGKNTEGLDISSLSSGVYFININSGSYKKVDKFIVVK